MFDELIRHSAALHNVPELWIRAVIQTESSFNPRAYRAEPQIHDASYGLMQLLYGTARNLGYSGTPEGLYDPAINIELGTQLLSELRNRYGDDIQAVYSAYNSGSATRYLNNADVASHVAHLMTNLETLIKAEPLIAGTGALGVLLLSVVIWYYSKNKRK